MASDKKQNIFQRILSAGETQIDNILFKAKTQIDVPSTPKPQMEQPLPIYEDDADTFYQKAIYKDMTYSVGVSGFTEKTNKLSYFFLKQMAAKDSVIAAIIQTQQNKVASFSKAVDTKHDRGFKISLKDEKKILRDIVQAIKDKKEYNIDAEYYTESAKRHKMALEGRNAMGSEISKENPNEIVPMPNEESDDINLLDKVKQDNNLNENSEEDILDDRELLRIAKKLLKEKTADKINAIENVLLNCGYEDHRPFESKKWTFDSFLRAIVRDSLTYDQFAVEIIPDNFGKLHYFVPVDGGTIRYATIDLRNYRDFQQLSQPYNILNPEREHEELLQRDILTLDDEKLKNNEYKYVQIMDGRVERAFTAEELALGMRNLTSDIWANGYSISELELLIGVVSSHLFTENFNKQFFINGFSAKGFIHIKDNLPRRKLESFRIMWQHMVKNNRNSFQTPIMSGVDEVKWVPLNQDHSDMEFSLWLQYLIRIMCAVYQIDPFEIGLGMREMGESGSSLSGDNSVVKLTQSKSKGFLPLMRFLEDFINKNIVDKIDSQFKLEWVGLEEESRAESLNRQSQEVKFKKTVNEIREEDGLPPLPGMDDLILDSVYMQFYNMYSPAGKIRQDELKTLLSSDSQLPEENDEGEEEVNPKNKKNPNNLKKEKANKINNLKNK